MNRTLLLITGVLSASSLLLVDSAIKGTALLIVAAAITFILRRDSAATRHLVWLLAIVAMLAVPVLSAMLPQWRVLPQWASIPSHSNVAATSLSPAARPAVGVADVQRNADPIGVGSPSVSANQSVSARLDSPPGLASRESNSASVIGIWDWQRTLPFVWAVGFCTLILRLMAARWMLWNTERQGKVIGSSQSAKVTDDPIVTALHTTCSQLGLGRPVILLIHSEKSIPVVWGIFRCCLMLPAAARDWSGEQLQSVLLHELAHIKRRDTVAQLLTQFACALHWFNPLVWLAAWRLGIERERACDDLVLASGVRPSAYAGHLLDVVTGLSPARWTQTCGLAMARKSSLEGRLVAVLSGGRNRRGVTRILAAAAVVLAAGVAIPLAMLRAAERDKPKAEAAAVNAEPKDPGSKSLFENWKTSARTDGKIPGGRIGEMAASLKTLMDLNPGHEQSVKLEPVLKKCDASRDWTPAEAAALLDEIAAITPRAEWAMRANTEREIHPGKPLPEELANAPWGKPAENGLRLAWLLEPRRETQALDSVMKSRVLFHNTGKAPVCFATEDWIQTGGHKAKDADGMEINVWAIHRLGIRLRMVFRLAPGEYAEVAGHGVGVGSHETSSEKSIYIVGCWIEAKEGDAVTFTPGGVPVSFQTWIDNEGLKNSVTVWQEMIAKRVMQESPMPAAAVDREQLFRRVIKDILGTNPSAVEIAAFVNDNAPDALERLIKTLQERAGAMHFAGELPGGETKFRVTAAVAKKDEPKLGAQLKPATEQKLKWGETVNGLRMAVAWPPTLDEAGIGKEPEFYLVVQNVSQAPVRLTANDAAPNPRRLIVWNDSNPISATADPSTLPCDWLLQPREVAFLHLYQPSEKMKDGQTISSLEENIIRVYPQYSVTGEMTIEKAPAGAWTGKLATGQTRGSADVIPPKHKDAQALYKTWATAARVDGKIPGGVIALLAQSVKTFIKNNPTWETTPQLEKMLPRFDASRDWIAQDAVTLLDELAVLQTTPIGMALTYEDERTMRRGTPLPPQLANAPFGEALPNGLRLAWLLEPRAAQYRLNTPLKSRILIHNTGKTAVVFRARKWHQVGHKASDAKGTEIKVESTSYLTRGQLVPFLLWPGEFVELIATGIGVGANKIDDDWQNSSVGSWIDAKAGDEVTVKTNPVPLSDWNEDAKPGAEPRWWLDYITDRLSRHLPFPEDTDARELMLSRIAMDLFGNPVNQEIRGAFVADHKPTAFESLAKRLATYKFVTPFVGSLQTAPTRFKVLPADPDAAKKPRVASNPGNYRLTETAYLYVSRRPVFERMLNEAYIQFYSPDPKKPEPGQIHHVKLPEGYDTWAAVWQRAGTVLWVLDKEGLRSYDFSNPAEVKEQVADPEKVPADVLEVLRALKAAFSANSSTNRASPPAASAKP